MKFAKLSLAAVAAMGITSGAMALDLSKATIKPYVNTKLYYETIDNGSDDSKLFRQEDSSGQALLQVGATGKLNGCWGYGLEASVADTLGLENQLVSNTRMGDSTGTHTVDQLVQTQSWMSQAYVTFRGCGTLLDKTTFKVGRQYLDTPLAFTETWNLAPNTFDAIVAVNSDIQNVTLVGAYVGKGNGVYGRVTDGSRFQSYGQAMEDEAGLGDIFRAGGAYAFGALTNFGLPVNVWYYSIRDAANAIWADTNYKTNISGTGVNFGLQYSQVSPKAGLESSIKSLGLKSEDTTGYAASLGVNFGDYSFGAAYSSVDSTKGAAQLALANTATGWKKTKLATAGIYTDGSSVAQPGSDAWKIKASANTPIGKITIQHINVENDDVKKGDVTIFGGDAATTNQVEDDIILATKVLGINTKLIYMNRSFDDQITGEDKKDSKHVRVVLSKKF